MKKDMFARLLFIFLAAGANVFAGGQYSFQTHYIPAGMQDKTVAIAADASGNFFIVSAENYDLPSVGIRATKTDPQGNFLGSLEFGAGVIPTGAAVDPSGSLIVVGTRQGDKSPSTGLTLAEAAIFKLANDLSQVVATAMLGNRMTGISGAGAVTTDVSGNVYVTGGTGATDFPVTPLAYQTAGPPSMGVNGPAAYSFITVLTNDLSRIKYSTYFGNPSKYCMQDACHSGAGTSGSAIAVDSSGVVTVAGDTDSPGLGGGGAERVNQWPFFGFIAKFRPDLGDLLEIVKLAPPVGEDIYSMSVDSKGHILVAGGGAADGLPFGPGAIQQHPHQIYSAGYFTYEAGFLAEYDSSLNLLWGTYFGAKEGNPYVTAAFDSQGNIWVTGSAQLFTLPGVNSTSTAITPFAAELSPDGSSVLNLATSQFGGTAVVATSAGSVAFLGSPDSLLTLGPPDQPSFLTVANSADNLSSGTIAPLELISLFGAGIGPAAAASGQVVNGAYTNTLSGYQVLFNGTPVPILYAGSDQFNVVSPRAIAGQQSVDIEVVGPQGSTGFPTVFVAASHPRIFPVALNQDGTLNSKSNPAPTGSTVTLWATGDGLTNDQFPDGAIVPSTGSGNPVLPISVICTDVRGIYCYRLVYAGATPGSVLGLTRIDFLWPFATNTDAHDVPIQFGDSVTYSGGVY